MGSFHVSALLMGLTSLSAMVQGDELVHAFAKVRRFIPADRAQEIELKGNHWYLQGYGHQRNDYRVFRLSRMSDLQMQEEVFLLRNYQRPQLDFDDIWTTIQTRIKIRIHKSVMDRVLDFCNYEDFLPDGNEHYIVNFPFVENEYHFDIFLSFGDQCECLEPLQIREKMKNRIHATAAIYN